MLGSREITLYDAKSLGDLFVIETHLLSTRTADAYKAIDRKKNTPVSIWKLRTRIEPGSELAENFLARIGQIAAIEPRVVDILGCGVTGGGEVFVVLPMLDGQLIAGGGLEGPEAERRFIAALSAAAAIHDAGEVCGDICASSFWVERSGEVRFIGVMGSEAGDDGGSPTIPPVESIPFISPEEQRGEAAGRAADVFALGVLGYLLFCKKYPYGVGYELLGKDLKVESVADPTSISPKAPQWLAEALIKSLNPDISKRFDSAGEMLDWITQRKAESLRAASTPTKTGRLISDRQSEPGGAREFSPEMLNSADGRSSAGIAPPRGRKTAVILAAVFALSLLILGAILLPGKNLLRRQGAALIEELGRHRGLVSSPDLKAAIDTLVEAGASMAERERQLQAMVNSDDPIAHDILVRIAAKADSAEFRAQAEKAVVDRARRFGLMRAAEQVKQWLRLREDGVEPPPDYALILQSLDSTLPIEARSAKLRAAYVSNPELSLRLAAALALDSSDMSLYQPILSQLVGDSAKLDDAKSRSALALIMFDARLSGAFGDDIVQRLTDLPGSDIPWLLGILASREDPSIRALAQSAIDKKILDPARQAFLEILINRGDIPSDVVLALVHGAENRVTNDDIGALGRWYDIASGEVLMLILASNDDQTILDESFDVLAGKSISSPAAVKFIAWIRSKHFNERGRLGSVIGGLNNIGSLSKNEAEAVLRKVEPYLKDKDLVGVLAEVDSPEIQAVLVRNYPETLGFAGLLNVLSTAPKEIRIDAVHALKAYNDVGALKLIIDKYERESDPDVRRAYKDTFWMIQEREDRTSGGGL